MMLTVLLFCLMAGHISAVAAPQNGGEEAVEKLLAQFDSQPTTASANDFFGQLLREEFFDEPVVFDADASTDSLRQQVWYWAAEYFYAHQHYHEGLQNALRALPLLHIPSEQADCMSLIALHYMRLGLYEQAAKYAKQSYQNDLTEGDADRISSALNTLSTIYMHSNQPREAEKYVEKGLEIVYKTDNTARQAVLEANACDVYRALGEYDKALQHISQAYRLDHEAGRTDRANVRLSQRAAVLIAQEHYAEAMLLPVISAFRGNGNRQSLGIALNSLGAALLGQGQASKAADCYREAANLFAEMGNTPNEMQAHRGLYEALWDSDPEAARHELECFNRLRDSLYTTASAESLARYSAEFGNDWLRLENHAERRAKTLAIMAIAVTLVAALVGWWFMRRRQRKQHRINEQLTSEIMELRQKYRTINVIQEFSTPPANSAEGVPLLPTDRDFLERVTSATNELINNGQPDATNLAAQLAMSPYQLRQRLKALLDETPQTFIQNIRMSRAHHLLEHHPELTINEVGTLCAYNDPSNFTRAFKNTFCITPTQYLGAVQFFRGWPQCGTIQI